MSTTPNIDRVVGTPGHDVGLWFASMEVVATTFLTPGMLRLTLGAADITPFATTHGNVAVRLFVPTADEPLAHVPLTPSAPEATVALRTRSRVYTRRAIRPDVGEMDIDMVHHAHDGLASGWAATAVPGDRVLVVCPRHHPVPPADSGRVLMVADASALPAVATILESAEAPADVHVVARVDPADRGYLPEGCPVTCVGDDDEAVAVTAAALASERLTVWAAGEHHLMRRVRATTLDGGVPRERLQCYAYWRRDASGTEVDEARAAAALARMDQGLPPGQMDDLDVDLP